MVAPQVAVRRQALGVHRWQRQRSRSTFPGSPDDACVLKHVAVTVPYRMQDQFLKGDITLNMPQQQVEYRKKVPLMNGAVLALNASARLQGEGRPGCGAVARCCDGRCQYSGGVCACALAWVRITVRCSVCTPLPHCCCCP